MTELARKISRTLWEFMDKTDDFVNSKDSLKALTAPRRSTLEQVESSSKRTSSGKTQEKARKIHMIEGEMEAHPLEIRIQS